MCLFLLLCLSQIRDPDKKVKLGSARICLTEKRVPRVLYGQQASSFENKDEAATLGFDREISVIDTSAFAITDNKLCFYALPMYLIYNLT